MRTLPKRPSLPPSAAKKLAEKSAMIASAVDAEKKDIGEKLYTNSRDAQWFQAIIQELKKLSGAGARCMYCSGSEAAQLEHYRPKAVFPELALHWENMLWVCGKCNLEKGDKFPMHAEQILINPIDENVWDFFRIDRFGKLRARYSPELEKLNPRAISTMEIVSLDREEIQQPRQDRLHELKNAVADSITLYKNGNIKLEVLNERLAQWQNSSLQPDVANYFLLGPGKSEPPFCELFALLNP